MAAVATADGKIYAIGGTEDGSNMLDTVYVYDLNTNTWDAETPLLTARGSLGAAYVDGTIYALGGYDTAGNASDAVEATGIVDEITYSSIRGSDRYDTAIRVSQAMFPGALPAGSGLVVAPGETFPEALCGAPLAAAYGGPVLLTYKSALANNVKAELQRLAPQYVFCIGLSTSRWTTVKTALPTATVTAINGTGATPNHLRHEPQGGGCLEAKVGDMTGATGHRHPRRHLPRCHRRLAPRLRQALAHHPHQQGRRRRPACERPREPSPTSASPRLLRWAPTPPFRPG